MPKPYDAITRTILERYPRDWLALLDLDPDVPVRFVDSNVSTVVAEADKVLRVEGPSPGLVHVEVQKDYDASMPLRLLRYNALLRVRHGLPVLSAVVLLLPDADGPAMSGRYAEEWPDGRGRVELTYPVVRVWQEFGRRTGRLARHTPARGAGREGRRRGGAGALPGPRGPARPADARGSRDRHSVLPVHRPAVRPRSGAPNLQGD